MQKCKCCKGWKHIDYKQIRQKIDWQAAEKLNNDKNNYWAQSEFQNQIFWFYQPNTDYPQLQHELLKKLAKQYKIIFEVSTIEDKQFKHIIKMISLSGVQSQGLFSQFLNHAIKIIFPIPTYFDFEFKKLKTERYTSYGSHELSQSLECTICLDKKSALAKTCCGKIICQGCNVSQKCPFCNQKPILIRPIHPAEIIQFKTWKEQILMTVVDSL